MQKIDFTKLTLGESYERPYLAELWGYQNWRPLGKGILTPKKLLQDCVAHLRLLQHGRHHAAGGAAIFR